MNRNNNNGNSINFKNYNKQKNQNANTTSNSTTSNSNNNNLTTGSSQTLQTTTTKSPTETHSPATKKETDIVVDAEELTILTTKLNIQDNKTKGQKRYEKKLYTLFVACLLPVYLNLNMKKTNTNK